VFHPRHGDRKLCRSKTIGLNNFDKLNVGSSSEASSRICDSCPTANSGASDNNLHESERSNYIVVKPHGRLVPVSSTPCDASTSGLSTSLSRRGLQDLAVGIPNLGVGFPLICFQRLSRPDMATRQCGWRHNRYTSGPFVPVLSY
jgi:hypothetical protein